MGESVWSHSRHQSYPPLRGLFISAEIKMTSKVDDGLKKEIEAGTKLKDCPEPETKLNSHDVTLFAVENFNKEKLKGVKTEEKSVLPTAEDIAAEKAEAS